MYCVDNLLFYLFLDPKARTLQEEFLRLQQQLLSLQMQAVVQQSNIPSVTEPTSKTEDATDRCRENIVIEEQTIVADVSKIVSADVPTTVEAERIEPVETPAQPPLEQQQYDEHFVLFF